MNENKRLIENNLQSRQSAPTLQAEFERGFDRSKLQNEAMEPLRETDLIDLDQERSFFCDGRAPCGGAR
jgi:hypothetical protein